MTRSPRIVATNGSTMRVQQWRTSLFVLFYVTVGVRAFSNPALPFQLSRGGDTAEADQEIDDYIEDLISTVDSSSVSSSEDVRDDLDVEEVVDTLVEVDKSEGNAVETNNVVMRADIMDVDDDSEEEVDDEEKVEAQGRDSDKETEEAEIENAMADGGDQSVAEKNEESENAILVELGGRQELSEPIMNTTNTRKKRRKKRSPAGVRETQKTADKSDATEQAEAVEESTPVQLALGPARPNALYRFLLNQGRLGHILLMICVLITELVQTYIPPLAHLLGFIFSFLLPSDEAEDLRRYRRGAPRGPTPKVNAQYAAFVSSDGSTIRGKQRKQQIRKADQQAAEKLRRVGSIQDAKFRHVSVDFMKR